MRKILILIVLFCGSAGLFAQEKPDSLTNTWKDYWKIEGRSYIHLSQGAQFNWAKGGDNIFSTLIKNQATAKYKKGKHAWDNKLNWNYGFLYVGVPEEKKIEYRTSDDAFEVNSSYGYVAKGKFYYNMLFNFKTNFFPNYKYPKVEDANAVSNFLSPAYVIFSAGMNYKANDNFNLMVSPLTSKTTIVVKEGEGSYNVDETKYGLKEGDRIYKEVGAYLKMHYKFQIAKDITAENDLNLFSNYQNNPQNVDFELKSDINFQINKNVKALITLHFIYDDDAAIPVHEYVDGKYTEMPPTKGLQFQEKIMVGFGINI